MRLQPKLFFITSPPAILSVVLIISFVYIDLFEKAESDVQQLLDLKLAAVGSDLKLLRTSDLSTDKAHDIINNAVDSDLERVLIVSDNAEVIFDTKGELSGSIQPSLLTSIPSDEYIGDENLGIDKALLSRYQLSKRISLIAPLPKSQITASIKSLANTVAMATFMGIMIGVIAFLTLMRFLVLTPLIRVREAALHLGSTENSIGSNFGTIINRTDEIGDLARSIDSTSRRLASSYSQLQSSHKEIERLAYCDTLTDLPNRRFYYDIVNDRIKQVKGKHPLYVLFLDIVDFKRVNDLLGHDFGDALLCEISKSLLDCLNINDPMLRKTSGHYVGRLGGDEFVIMVDGKEKSTTIENVAHDILLALSNPVALKNQMFSIKASLGIATYPQDGASVADLIMCADTAMREAKKNRRNQFERYNQSMRSKHELKRQLEIDLRSAVLRHQLFLHYQPKFCMRSMKLQGAEALLRWQHPEKGLVPPDQFIPIAEENKSISEIGSWVLDEACRQWSEWNTLGFGINQVAVNVSILQFAAYDLYTLVCETLEKHSMPASALELELTESCVVEALDEVLITLTALRQHGIKIAMDDFGTGYSSLGCIATLPIDTLKLDRSFVSNLQPGTSNEKIVNSVLLMAKGLNLSVVAEGIENQSELDLLRAGGCDLAQGYLLSRPLSVDAMSVLLAEEIGVDLQKRA